MEKKNILKADQIYRIMTEIKKGNSLKSNPKDYTNKIIDTQDPLVKLRQNKNKELEVILPLPISKVNSCLSPIEIDEICSITMSVNKNLPRSNIAFVDEKVAKIVESKLFSDVGVGGGIDGGGSSVGNGDVGDGNNFVYKIMVSHLEEEQNFAVNPMQVGVGKWFPGMLTVYSD